MSKSTLLFSTILCLLINSGKSQTNLIQADTLLVGTWRGTSQCQVKNSPCHDETVVYYISKKPGSDSFFIDDKKIVNGVEEEMGILPCVYNKKTNLLTPTAYKGIWTFKIRGNKLDGTLFVHGGL